MDLIHSVVYFITVNKYQFCLSVIGYINVQITNFPITKPFKVTKKEKKTNGRYLGQSGQRLKKKYILSFLLKKRTNIHITNTYNIQIKQTVLYFQVQ